VGIIGRGGEVLIVDMTAAGTRLDKWLADTGRLGSRSRAAEALLHGRVWVNDVEQQLADGARRLAGGETVRVWADRPGSAARLGARRSGPLDIVFEDADILVLAKPAGLLTVPLPEQPDAPSLADHVCDYWRSHAGRLPRAVHRLDRDTSGLVVFARSARAQTQLKDQFASRSPARVYLAVVYGTPDPHQDTWRTWLTWDPRARVQRPVPPHTPRAYEAVARYSAVEELHDASLIEVRLHTGKRHQIRAQAWLAGHPLVGERIYTGPPAPSPPRPIPFTRQALHATHLGFAHPRTGQPLAFDLPPPADIAALVARLRRRR
jgi:23S rRNA pseudouridine1911/1915/1917 synthase